jgi:hypothetical protein
MTGLTIGLMSLDGSLLLDGNTLFSVSSVRQGIFGLPS